MKLGFMHIPKCAGTSVRIALQNNFPWQSCSPLRFPYQLNAENQEHIDGKSFFAAHWGFDEFEKQKCDVIVTILRDPLDRLISLYNYHNSLFSSYAVQDVPKNIRLAHESSFLDWLSLDESDVQIDIDNAITYQIAGLRGKELHGYKHSEVLNIARMNLSKCVVGFMTMLDIFEKEINEIGLEFKVHIHNKTKAKSNQNVIKKNELSDAEIQFAMSKLSLDYQLYSHALTEKLHSYSNISK